MRFIEFLTESAPKRRPRGKTFWYDVRKNPNADRYWRNDIQHRLPNARFIGDEENEEVFAVSPDDEDDCFGVWRYKEGSGTTFGKARPLKITARPRAKFSSYQLP